MRSYHRWVGVPAAIFFLFIAFTGIGLQLDLWIQGKAPPGTEAREARPKSPPLPDDEALRAMVTRAADGFRQRHANEPVHMVEFSFDSQKPVASFRSGSGSHIVPIRIDLATGREIPPPEPRFNWHNFLQDLHAGYRFGIVGRIISVLAGLSLIILVITGLNVYLDLFRRRRKAGKRNPFWK